MVDDEPHIGVLLQLQLAEYGCELTIARTLEQARSALAGPPVPDAMLLDVHLPDGSGLEWLAELRREAATRALPVLVLTAEGDEGLLRTTRALGSGLVTKPFSPSKLVTRVLEMLGGTPV